MTVEVWFRVSKYYYEEEGVAIMKMITVRRIIRFDRKVAIKHDPESDDGAASSRRESHQFSREHAGWRAKPTPNTCAMTLIEDCNADESLQFTAQLGEL